MGIFSVIGTIGKALFGGGKDSAGTSTNATPDYAGQIAIMKAEAEVRQQEFQQQQKAESAKQQKMFMMIGAIAGLLVLLMFLRKK